MKLFWLNDFESNTFFSLSLFLSFCIFILSVRQTGKGVAISVLDIFRHMNIEQHIQHTVIRIDASKQQALIETFKSEQCQSHSVYVITTHWVYEIYSDWWIKCDGRSAGTRSQNWNKTKQKKDNQTKKKTENREKERIAVHWFHLPLLLGGDHHHQKWSLVHWP